MQKYPCDYLGHVEIRLFPTLKFYFDNNKENSYFYCQGGRFRQYKRDSEVPIQTLYYKLPQTFFVITYMDDLMLLKVENGIFTGIGDIDKDFKPGIPVLDIFGNLLNAKTINDIKVIKLEYERFKSNEITSEKFISLWIDTDNIQEDILMFGRYIDIFRMLYIQENEEYFKFKKYFKDFLEKQNVESLVQRYKNWLGNEIIIPYKDIDKIVKLVFE